MEFTILQSWWSSVWVQAGILIVIAYLAGHFGGAMITQIVRRTIHSTRMRRLSEQDLKKRQDTLISVLSVVWKIIIFTTLLFTLVRMFFPALDLTPMFASAGIIGIALGFGAQSLVRDFLSGIFILIENQYRVGDVVDIDGAAGTVERITLRCTILRDINGNVHYLPNGNILHAINKTMDFGKVNFTIAVHPDADIDQLTTIINAVGHKMAKDKAWRDKIIDPPEFLNLGAFNDTALEVNITGKTQPAAQWSVTSELKKRLIRELDANDIELSQYSQIKFPGAGPIR
jgi:moderate conductance mechanosensitive channel